MAWSTVPGTWCTLSMVAFIYLEWRKMCFAFLVKWLEESEVGTEDRRLFCHMEQVCL